VRSNPPASQNPNAAAQKRGGGFLFAQTKDEKVQKTKRRKSAAKTLECYSS
jgi:hypothetical protein